MRGWSSSNRFIFWCMIWDGILKVGVKVIFGYSGGAPKMICLKIPSNLTELGQLIRTGTSTTLWRVTGRYSSGTDKFIWRISASGILFSHTVHFHTPVTTLVTQSINENKHYCYKSEGFKNIVEENDWKWKLTWTRLITKLILQINKQVVWEQTLDFYLAE